MKILSLPSHWLSNKFHKEFKGYPDRHCLHYELMIKLLGAPFSDIHFLLVNTTQEAYEPIIRVLATNHTRVQWHKNKKPPFRFSQTIHSWKTLYKKIVFVTNDKFKLFQMVSLTSYYLPKKTSNFDLNKIIYIDAKQFAEDKLPLKSKVIVVDESYISIKNVREISSNHLDTWFIVYVINNIACLGEYLNDLLCEFPNIIIIYEFPQDLKTGNEMPSAVILADPEVINQIQAHSYVVWYNMDHIHTKMLLTYLQKIPISYSYLDNSLDNEYKLQSLRIKKGKIRMDFNETRTQPNNNVINMVRNNIDHLDINSGIAQARRLLAENLFIPQENILLSRGANHAIKRAIMGITSKSDYVIIPDVTYIAHIKGIIGSGAEPIYAPVFQKDINDPLSITWDIQKIIDLAKVYQPRMICLSNPSNPLGEILDSNEFYWFIEAVKRISPNTVLLIDTCFNLYSEFLGSKMPNYSLYLKDYNIVVVGSLSKEDGYAGARTGYIYGSSAEIALINETFPQEDSISVLGLSTLLASRSYTMRNDRLKTVSNLVSENRRIKEYIDQEELVYNLGVRVKTTAASFFLLYIPIVDTTEITGWFSENSNIDISTIKKFKYSRADSFNNSKFHVSGENWPNIYRVSPGTITQDNYFLVQYSKLMRDLKNTSL